MADKLRIIIFWVVLASGLSVVLLEQGDFAHIRWISLTARTLFWTSAIAYFSLRLYGRFSGNR
ncbi:MAG: hypothetical protein V1794_01025 [Candidatus Glassbacteria bacterium]